MSRPKALSIDLLRIDGDTQARVSINEDTVEDYAAIIAEGNGDWQMGPVDVFHDGSEYWLADGFHRTLAAIRVERASIPCIVHKGTQRDARIFGMTANDQHGLRMTRADKRRCVEWLLDNGGKMTQQKIAETAGVHVNTVKNVVAERREAENRKISAEQTTEQPTQTSVQTTEKVQIVPSGDAEEVPFDVPSPEAPETGGDATIVLDAVDRPVPDEKRAAHGLSGAIQSSGRQLDAVLREVKELAKKPGGEFIDVASIEIDLKALKGRLVGACYWSECPKCKGEGCHDCRKTGWWPRNKKGHLSAADKEWLGCS